MESRAKILGHPVHPMLVVFPLGLLVTSFIFDMIRLGSGNDVFSTVAFYMISAGLIGGVLAAIFGFIDWLAIPAATRAKSLGLWHGAGNAVVLVLFLISWALRFTVPAKPPGFAVFLSLIGVLLGGVTAWLGGELVDRLGIGVADGANLNAPSSLAERPRRAA